MLRVAAVVATLLLSSSPLSGCYELDEDLATDLVLRWNAVMLAANANDHGLHGGPDLLVGQREQYGPTRTARAFAIVHVAMFEAVNAIVPLYESYCTPEQITGPTSLNAAIATAARDTLAALYPGQRALFDAALASDLAQVPAGAARQRGIELGAAAAARILAAREHDGAELQQLGLPVLYDYGQHPGQWRADPRFHDEPPLTPRWGDVTPFAMAYASQFRTPPPPKLYDPDGASPGAADLAAYIAAYVETKTLGGDGVTTPTARTPEQTLIGIFWAYDASPGIGTPPRIYNQVARAIAQGEGNSVVANARLFALVNLALADAALAAWESKYVYRYWRPITGIREADAGTGPTGTGDGIEETLGDPAWVPLGSPASNGGGRTFTPPFPAYPSGHAALGGALFQILRRYYGRDDIAFSFVSDELDGTTRDPFGTVRPLVIRSFASLSEAEEENGQSRIYLGIHWSFDKTEGIAQGRRVADHVFDHELDPL